MTPHTTIGFDAYWRFAHERHKVYLRKLSGEHATLTFDEVLRVYRFTNAFRAADRVSQFLIASVQYDDDWNWEDTFARTLVFKIFNRIGTWQHIVGEIGQPNLESLMSGEIDVILEALAHHQPIYSAAYIMPPPRSSEGPKFSRHLELLRRMVKSSAHERILEASSMAEAYEVLRGFESIGNFLAYQYVVDLNYSRHLSFDEDDFVVAGPGAMRGLRKCFADSGKYSPAELIRWTRERQQREFASRGLEWNGLWGRELRLIDVQNLFCEVDKYARVALPELSDRAPGRRIKQRYRPDPSPMSAWFPPKWGINEDSGPSVARSTQMTPGGRGPLPAPSIAHATGDCPSGA